MIHENITKNHQTEEHITPFSASFSIGAYKLYLLTYIGHVIYFVFLPHLYLFYLLLIPLNLKFSRNFCYAYGGPPPSL